MSKQSCKTFRLAFVRRRINTTFRSRALRAALVVQMEQVRPRVSPPTQAVAPMPQPNGEHVTPEAQVRPVNPQANQVAPPDGQTAATAVEISDSEDEAASRRSSSSD